MLGSLKDKLLGGINRVAGNTDFLEAVCASSALVAAADGTIDDEEVGAALAAVKTNPTLSKAFKVRDIEKCMNASLERASNRTGRLALMNELGEVTEDQGEMVYLAALDVAHADGKLDPAEQTMLDKIANKLGVDGAALDI